MNQQIIDYYYEKNLKIWTPRYYYFILKVIYYYWNSDENQNSGFNFLRHVYILKSEI